MKSSNKIPIPSLDLGIGYKRENKKILHITRTEDDKFKICEPKEIRQRKLFGEKIWLVHRLKDRWDIELLR
jgi:hypothetical protein